MKKITSTVKKVAKKVSNSKVKVETESEVFHVTLPLREIDPAWNISGCVAMDPSGTVVIHLIQSDPIQLKAAITVKPNYTVRIESTPVSLDA